MTTNKPRPWTDEEIGYVSSAINQPEREVAEHLGRSAYSIRSLRYRLRNDWSKKLDRWTGVEDEVIATSAQDLSNAEVARLLPGRSVRAVGQRRVALGIYVGHKTRNDPWAAGSRTMIARTCTKCGLLLPASWFSAKGAKKRAFCKGCARVKAEGRVWKSRGKDGYTNRAQSLTLETSTRNGQEYTESDHNVMSDPSTTNLSKALAMSRTYHATCTAVIANGYKSAVWLSDPKLDQWLIDNPNIARIDEITALLRQPESVATSARPDFEWDD